MKFVVALLALFVACSEARPNRKSQQIGASLYGNIDSQIIGGVNANPGEFPHQISQQRNGGHSCGASLLSAKYTLSASHCVDGAVPNTIRIVAGLHARSNEAGTSSSIAASYKMHEQYNNGQYTYNNDIAIITTQDNINIGGNIQGANLPANNANDFAGQTCVISGWGRDSDANTLPDILQKADIVVLSVVDCNNWVGNIGPGHACVQDPQNNRGACNGDSGGPINCGGQVIGVASFVFVNNGNCLPAYPSVYTRVPFYLDWIATNTP